MKYFMITNKIVEFIGVITAIIGSFLVARNYLETGFILFFISSALLLYTAIKQKNHNLSLLQGVFLISNALGISKHIFGV